MAYVNKSKTDSWATPAHIRLQLSEQFGGPNGFSDFDPCPLGGANDPSVPDGLSTPWPTNEGPIYVNPPYSKLGSTKGGGIGWMEKCLLESKRGTTIVCLIPLRCPSYYWDFIYQNADEHKVSKRLKFGNAKNSAPFDCCVYVFRYGNEPKEDRICGAFHPRPAAAVQKKVVPPPLPVVTNSTAAVPSPPLAQTAAAVQVVPSPPLVAINPPATEVGDVFVARNNCVMRKAVVTKITVNQNNMGKCWRVIHFSAKVVWVYKAHNHGQMQSSSYCCEDAFLNQWNPTDDARGLQSGFSQPLHVADPKVKDLIPKDHLHLTLIKTNSKKQDVVQACRERGLATKGTRKALYALWKTDVVGLPFTN